MSETHADADDTSNGEGRSLNDIIDAVVELGRSHKKASVGDLVDALGRASGVSVMLVAAAVATTPLSGIPGLSGFCGIVILLSAAQLFAGRTCIWLPDFMRRRKVDGQRLQSAIETLRKPAEFLDRYTRERLSWFVRGPGKKLIQGLCVLAGAMMPLLELIPFSASVMGATVSFFSVALLSLDGLWAALGLAFLATAGTLVIVLV